jgi:hypothetical protein
MILLGFVFYSEGFRGRTSLFCLLRAQNCSTAGILPPARRQCNLHKKWGQRKEIVGQREK